MTTLGNYQTGCIYTGECAALMAGLPDGRINLTVTSPPYDDLRKYNGYTFDYKPIARQLYRVTRPGGVVVWVVSDATKGGSESLTSFRQALYFVDECGFNLHDTMIYEISGTGAKGSNKAYWQTFEYMFVFSKGAIATYNLIADKVNAAAGSQHGIYKKAKVLDIGSRLERGRRVTGEYSTRTNIWRYRVGAAGGDSNNPHPAPFPQPLAQDHILSWSNPGDIVFDPMCGSGTTLRMAKATGRRWLGFDISAEYCELARERVEQVIAPFGAEE